MTNLNNKFVKKASEFLNKQFTLSDYKKLGNAKIKWTRIKDKKFLDKLGYLEMWKASKGVHNLGAISLFNSNKGLVWGVCPLDSDNKLVASGFIKKRVRAKEMLISKHESLLVRLDLTHSMIKSLESIMGAF